MHTNCHTSLFLFRWLTAVIVSPLSGIFRCSLCYLKNFDKTWEYLMNVEMSFPRLLRQFNKHLKERMNLYFNWQPFFLTCQPFPKYFAASRGVTNVPKLPYLNAFLDFIISNQVIKDLPVKIVRLMLETYMLLAELRVHERWWPQ